MRTLILVIALTMTASAWAGGATPNTKRSLHQRVSAIQQASETRQAPMSLQLADGTTLTVHRDGSMAMADESGRPIAMRAGVEMTLDDGNVVVMRNAARHDHRNYK